VKGRAVLQARLPVYIGSLAVVILLLLTVAVLDRLGVNLIEALYLTVLAFTLIGYSGLEWRGR
jgi:hypothetical protein